MHDHDATPDWGLIMPSLPAEATPVYREALSDCDPLLAMRVLGRFRIVFNAVKRQGQQVETDVGLARASTDPHDVLFHVTAAGLAVLDQVADPSKGMLPEALGSLQPQTLLRLDQALTELIEVLLHANERAGGMPLAEP